MSLRLLCRNDGVINKNGQECKGTGLVKNEIYSTDMGPIKDKYGFINYYVLELDGLKLAERFEPLNPDYVDNLLNSIQDETETVEDNCSYSGNDDNRPDFSP